MYFMNPFAEKGNWYKGNLHTHTIKRKRKIDLFFKPRSYSCIS